jgi:hypothetical protein
VTELDDQEERSLVRFFTPGSLQVGFEDTLELHRAVSGGQVPVHDFVEALVAEALCGAVPAEVDHGPLRRGASRCDIENRLALVAGGWASLDDAEAHLPGKGRRKKPKAERKLDAELSRLLTDAITTCNLVHALAHRAGQGGARELNQQIVELLKLDDAVERSMGRLLGWIGRYRACAENLFSGVGHYAEERLGMNRREAQLRAWVDRKLVRFPLLQSAYYRGELGLEAAAVVIRILWGRSVARNVEAAWLEHATKTHLKRLRDEARIVLRAWFEDCEEGPALPLDDETWFKSLALFPGTTRRRLKNLVERNRPSDHHFNVGTMFSLRLPTDLAGQFLGAVEDRRQRCSDGLASAPSATRLAKMFSARSQATPAWVGLLALLEEYIDTWDDPKTMPRRRFAGIYARHGWRCAAPGCTSRCHLDAHHLIYESQGGPDAPWNLVALCRFHHRFGEHGLLASCRGKAPLGIVWRMGHVSVGLWFINEQALRAAAAQVEAEQAPAVQAEAVRVEAAQVERDVA